MGKKAKAPEVWWTFFGAEDCPNNLFDNKAEAAEFGAPQRVIVVISEDETLYYTLYREDLENPEIFLVKLAEFDGEYAKARAKNDSDPNPS